MLAITISWIAISFIFLSSGDFFIFLYNKSCKQDEEYGTADTFLLGMCFTLAPLSISSFWLSANQYILLLYFILSAVYWSIRKERLYIKLKLLKTSLRQSGVFQLIAFIVPVLAIMLAILWQVGVFDSLFYHQQNIRWNEEFAVVPGLGNLEHRFSFNSNYLLLSALFSFRFLFGEAVYSLHVLVLVYILCWILKEIFTSGYEIKRIILLIVFNGYIFTFGYSLASTSTDAIPNIISFYLVTKLLLYPDSIKRKLLYYVSIPVALITFKVNIMPLCLISLYAAYTFFAQKQYRRVVFAFAGSFLIVALWLGRNVILSGYLVFPFSEIDLFAVDWKIPEQIAVEERDFIRSCGIRLFNDTINQLKIFDLSVEGIKGWLISFIFAGFAIISPVVVLYSCLRKKYLNKTVYLVYVSLLLIFLTWYIGGPDPRFIGGTLFAMVYIVMHLLLPGKKEIKLIRTGRVMIALFVLIMATWPMTRTGRFSGMFGLSTHTEGMRPVSNVLIRPYPYRELLKSAGIYKDDFHIYDFSKDVFVYISESPEILNGRYVCFDSPFPCTVSASGAGIKYLDVTGIEPRGGSLQKGFRVKK